MFMWSGCGLCPSWVIRAKVTARYRECRMYVNFKRCHALWPMWIPCPGDNEKTQQQQKQNKNYCMSFWPGRECIFLSTVKQIAGPPDLNVYLHAYSRHKPHGQSEWSWESNLFLFNHSTAIPCANNCVISKSSGDPGKIINSLGPEVRFYIESNQSPRSEVNRQVYVWLNVGCISQMRIMYSFHYIVILNNTRVDWHCRYANYICMIYWHVIKKMRCNNISESYQYNVALRPL